MPKMTLGEAAQLVGLSVNGMRSRAKAQPGLYGLSRDNAGRLWLDFDSSKVQLSKPAPKPSTAQRSKASVEGRVTLLEARLEAAELARRAAETDRDHWRRMAENLAVRRWWWRW